MSMLFKIECKLHMKWSWKTN